MRIVRFLLQLFIVVALVVWLAERPGSVHVVWLDYAIDMSASVLIILVLMASYLIIQMHALWRYLWDGPRFWRLKRRIGKLEEGHKICGMGFAALAGGQASLAGKLAVQARHLMGETSLNLFLQAQAAQQSGDTDTATKLFEALSHDKEAALLGYRGLIAQALRQDDFAQVSRMLYRLEQTHDEAPWVNLVRFELQCRQQNWEKANSAFLKVGKAKILPKGQAACLEAAMLLGQAREALHQALPKQAVAYAEKARKLCDPWVPASLLLAEAQHAAGYAKAAWKTIARAYAKEAHPQLLMLVLAKAQNPMEGYKLVEKMTRGQQEQPVAAMALAEAALQACLWGEARRFLQLVLAHGAATKKTYQLLMQLEHHDKGQHSEAALWLAKAVSAKVDPQWICSSCGAAYDQWQATCSACDAFNQMSWDRAGESRHKSETLKTTDLLDYLR